jgi:hypothetical protein
MGEARAPGTAIALLATLALLATPAAPAGAVASVTPAARGLSDSRLYVDPAVAETVTAGTRRRLARALARRPEHIFVALVAFAPGDAFSGDGPAFLSALAGRLQRPGIYVTYDARGILWSRGYRAASAQTDRADLAAETVNLEGSFRSLPGPRLTNFLAALDDPDLPARARRASIAFNKHFPSTTPPAGGVSGGGQGGGDDGGSGALLAIAGAAALLLAGGGVLLLRRRRAHPVDDRPVLPARVFALAREATRDELAERADQMLIALSGLIDAAPAGAPTQRALDAYEAAERVLRRDDRDVPDLVGALVCIDLGRAAIEGEPGLQPPCTYDPRHGAAHGSPVTVEHTKLRLCRDCRADVRAGRPANVLRDGSGRPYLDADSPWAASGYGAWADPIRAVLDQRS